ncbi:MAG: 3' terminal RNA ribose 2'-O-methyltransferase Hen1 [Planctomycetes bacterium]|nr:3' terminal RNA ribose 2'-O-methyltransferase Hen1 [Planctomycetota bacterium]
MLLTITTSTFPATDLGFLLHKNPARAQSFDLSFGKAHVFYPEAAEQRCTAALLLEIDPIGLVRGKPGSGEGHSLDQYVNDRPYVASSFLSVAIAQIFGSALAGRSKERPELASKPLKLEATLSVIPCRGGEAFLRSLFEPLGYRVSVEPHSLDPTFPEWGDSVYFTLHLQGTRMLQELLSHLYVLVPVLDNSKHYWVGEDEVEKLLRHGEGWLAGHPEKDAIARRYLKHRRDLCRDALSRLVDDDLEELESTRENQARQEAGLEEKIRLHDHRMGAVVAVLREVGAKSVMDLGCGEGRLLRDLLADKTFERVLGMDVSHRALEFASDKLKLERMPDIQKARLQLIQGSLTYRDKRLEGFDAAALIEVVEHLDPGRLDAFERVLFEHAKPRFVVLTTPNSDYNVKFETLPAGQFRHKDHRFEWSRVDFRAWAERVASRAGYQVRILPVGPEDAVVGAPTQMAVFSR